MTPNPYSEDHLVEQPALALLAELGWQIACGLEETFAPEGGSLGRRDRREVVLLPQLRAALEALLKAALAARLGFGCAIAAATVAPWGQGDLNPHSLATCGF